MKNHKKAALNNIGSAKRLALYARVSTEEQTRGQYPSCASQIEELQAATKSRGWEVHSTIKDEGYSAGTLKRPGLSELRWLVESGQIDGVMCTWYDRLSRSRDFYTLDKEFRAQGVEFITLHDPTDTTTAAGRFMESMLVAAKTYEREQTGEKVSTKMRMRAEKGMWNGGHPPFGFVRDYEAKTIRPEPEKIQIIEQMYRVYVENRSDFVVRDWLKAYQIPTRQGKPLWAVGTIRDVLTNRLYIGQIEINRHNKGVEGLSEQDAYHVVQASHGALIPIDLFDLAQVVRREKAALSPRRVGRPRSYSQNQCKRVYPLQGVLSCGVCGHAMAPHYTYHKPGGPRRTASYIHYYVCAPQIKGAQESAHKNRVLARISEAWILESVQELVEAEGVLERCLERAWMNYGSTTKPQQEAFALTQTALQENQSRIDTLLETVSSGKASETLFTMLNEKANQLQLEREKLQAELRRLSAALLPLQTEINPDSLRQQLADLVEVIRKAEPAEQQRLVKLLVKTVQWMPDGVHRIQYWLPNHTIKTNQPKPKVDKDWFATQVRLGCPRGRNVEPVFFEFLFVGIDLQCEQTLVFSGSEAALSAQG